MGGATHLSFFLSVLPLFCLLAFCVSDDCLF
eukprot:COSAG06_NODE_82796_length_101_cov_15624.000000_1_plen_30_part_01